MDNRRRPCMGFAIEIDFISTRPGSIPNSAHMALAWSPWGWPSNGLVRKGWRNTICCMGTNPTNFTGLPRCASSAAMNCTRRASGGHCMRPPYARAGRPGDSVGSSCPGRNFSRRGRREVGSRMVRNVVRSGLAGVLRWSGADRLLGHMVCGNVPLVLTYHSVVEDIAMHRGYSIPENLISQRMLERQLDWLGCRYRFISLDELGARLEHGQPFDRPAVAITFDDGYSSVYHHAFPLLKRKGIPAGLFVVTDLIGTARLQIYDKLYLLLTRAFSRWQSASQELARLLTSLEVRLHHVGNTHSVARDPLRATRAIITTLSQPEICR